MFARRISNFIDPRRSCPKPKVLDSKEQTLTLNSINRFCGLFSGESVLSSLMNVNHMIISIHWQRRTVLPAKSDSDVMFCLQSYP